MNIIDNTARMGTLCALFPKGLASVMRPQQGRHTQEDNNGWEKGY